MDLVYVGCITSSGIIRIMVALFDFIYFVGSMIILSLLVVTTYIPTNNDIAISLFL